MMIFWEKKLEWAFLLSAILASLLTLVKLKQLSRNQILFLAGGLGVLYLLGVRADDDVHRYIVEGWALAHGMNPYLVPPVEVSSNLVSQELVNHPLWTAIYGPFFLELMAWLTYITTSVLGLKILWLGLHALNSCLIGILRKDRLWAYYLCSPYVLFETVGQAHLEGLVVLGALLLVLGLERGKTVTFTLGLIFAFWIKWWAIPLALILLRRKTLKAWGWFALASVMILWPFSSEPLAMLSSLREFEGMWTNGYPHLWLEWAFGSWAWVPIGMTMGAILLAVILLGGDLHEQIWQFFRLGLLIAPTLHPWYWVMPLTMALLSSKVTTFCLMGIAALALHHPEFSLAAGEGWQSAFWTVAPILLLSVLSEWRMRRHILGEKGEGPMSLTVVTPALNESSNLKELGEMISKEPSTINEWIVVDGGSDDESVPVARELGARVLEPGVKGRGSQIRHGVESAKTEWVMILHADTRFGSEFFSGWKQAMGKVPEADGGAFRLAYRGKMPLGPLMFLNDLKMRWFGMSFGDQTQFFRKSSIEKRGGFPDLPLMEDVELSMILKGGNVAYLDHLISWTSPRRWEAKGRLSNALQIIRLLMTYLWKRHWNPPVDVRAMYRSYYPT